MKNLVIFLYFVFLFKLAFAQSLPSIPGLKNGTLGQGTEIITDEQERIQLAQAEVIPEDLNLPELNDEFTDSTISDASEEDGIKIGKSKKTDEKSAEIKTVTQPEVTLPYIDEKAPDISSATTEELPVIEAPSMETGEVSNKTIEVDQFQTNDFENKTEAVEKKPEVEVLKPEDFQAITLDNLGEKEKVEDKNQFPQIPDIGYKKRENDDDSNQSGLTSEERERQTEKLLNDLLPPEQDSGNKKDLIITKEKKKIKKEMEKEPEVEQVFDDGIAKDYENLGKPGRIGYKPITYSEDQLTEQFVKAAITGNKQAVVDLLHSGRPANSRNKFGETPLMASIYNGHNEITELLLVEGADANIQDVRGNTPLHVSAARRNYFAAQQLIRNGAIIDGRNRANDTPLLIATLNGSLDIVDLLVREGADVNKANDDGLTPLHVAAYNGNIELVKYLLYVGANANMVTREGYKPYDLAYGKNLAVAQTLASYTNAQKYVSKELPKIIQERNKKPILPQSNSSYSDPYIMFPKAYQEPEEAQMKEEQLSYEQEQYNWWAATKRGEKNVQNIESTGFSTTSPKLENIEINSLPPTEISEQQYAKNMTGVDEKGDIKIKTQTSTITYNDVDEPISDGEIELPTQAVQKFDELVQNRDKDPKFEGKGVEFTEGKQPVELNENLRRKTDNRFKQEAKINYAPNIKASDLGGIIRTEKQEKLVQATTPAAIKQPLTSSISFSVGSKYAAMSNAQKQQWDIRLDRWVKSGFREYNMSENERQLWLKQKQILENIYRDEFASRVERLKTMYVKAKNISYSQSKPVLVQHSSSAKPSHKPEKQTYYKPTPISIQRKLANQKYRSRLDSSVAYGY